MKTRLRHAAWLVFILMAGQLCVSVIEGQPLPFAESAAPPLPAAKSPVGMFRKLLAMTPAQRDSELAGRLPAVRQIILAKLAEYEALKPEDCELRLQVTDLRWNLYRVLPYGPDQRAKMLADVPEAERQSLTDRLQQWDALPVEERQEILKYDRAMEDLASQRLASATNGAIMPPPLPPEATRGFDHFRSLPAEQRQEIMVSFQQFFELTDAEKLRTLETLSPPARVETSNALRNLGNLPKPQRDQYMTAFQKFSSMTDEERQEFLKNAERWKALPPAEREAWRNLVNHVPPLPPLPPGFVAPPPLPPLPPTLQVSAPEETNATNSLR